MRQSSQNRTHILVCMTLALSSPYDTPPGQLGRGLDRLVHASGMQLFRWHRFLRTGRSMRSLAASHIDSSGSFSCSRSSTLALMDSVEQRKQHANSTGTRMTMAWLFLSCVVRFLSFSF
jgi:hypothetical protein